MKRKSYVYGPEGQPAAVPEPQLLQHGEQGQRLRPEDQADAAAAEPSLAAQQRRQSVIATHSFFVVSRDRRDNNDLQWWKTSSHGNSLKESDDSPINLKTKFAH